MVGCLSRVARASVPLSYVYTSFIDAAMPTDANAAAADGGGDTAAPPVVEEPEHLCCPITRAMFLDPVFVAESGNTYERDALERFWRASAPTNAARDPLTNERLESRAVYTNWDKRREVAAWLDAHEDATPSGWTSRRVPPPAREKRDGADAGGRPRGWLARAFGAYAPVKVAALAVLVSVALSASVGAGPRAPGRAAGAAGSPRVPTIGEFGDARELRAPAGSSRATIREVSAASAYSESTPALEVYVGTTKAFGSRVADLGFTALWFSITGTWTYSALAASPLFATFSVPFWFVGFNMLHSGATSAFETTRLLITPQTFYLEKIIFNRRLSFHKGETQDLTRAVTETYAYVNGVPQTNLVLHQGVKSHVLARGLHVVEDEFVIEAIGSFLKQYQRGGNPSQASRQTIKIDTSVPRARM